MHGKKCCSRFSKNNVKNLILIVTRKSTERTLKFTTANMHFNMYQFPSAVVTNHHKLADLKELCSFSALQAIGRAVYLLEDPGKFPCLPLPSFWGLPAIAGGAWLAAASLWSPPPVHTVFVSICAFFFPVSIQEACPSTG